MIRMQDVFSPLITTGGINWGLGHLEEQASIFAIDMNPPYQREHVWTTRQRELFAGHMLSGGQVQSLLVNQPDGKLGRGEMLDGKQRLTTMLMWVRGELHAELLDGRRFIIDETDRRFRLGLDFRVEFVELSAAEAVRFYLRLNSGGTPHSDEELERVRRLLLEVDR